MPTEKAVLVGSRLRIARQERKWHKTQAAEAVGTKPPVWQRYEDGDIDPSLSFLIRVSDVFEKPVSWFLGDIDDEQLRRQLGGLDPLLVSAMAGQPFAIQRIVARSVPIMRDLCREEGLGIEI